MGYSGDTPSSNKYTEAAPAQQGGSLTAAIPARTGLTARMRMPFYLIPGDLLLVSPLYFASPKTYEAMAVTAVNGGLIPWQLGWATRFGRFQFVLGREVGVTFHGLWTDDPSLLAPGAPPGSGPRVVQFESTYFEFPILEYRPYRSFDTTQSSALVLQLFGGVDIPNEGTVGLSARRTGRRAGARVLDRRAARIRLATLLLSIVTTRRAESARGNGIRGARVPTYCRAAHRGSHAVPRLPSRSGRTSTRRRSAR